MISEIITNRITRFLISGGMAAANNLFLMFLFVDFLSFNTFLLRNLANAISVEVSLLLSYFIYRLWVWPGGNWNLQRVLFKQLPLYHLSASSAIIIRIVLVFPLLDWFGITYSTNTLIGIIIGATVNYILSDNLLFKTKKATTSEIYYPEGLATAFLKEPKIENPDRGFRSPRKAKIDNPPNLSIIIPANNEEGCIEQTIRSICQILDQYSINYDILVINDHSQDKTEVLLCQLSHNNRKVRYINNYLPHGFGFAVRCGLENYEGDTVAIVMADGSDDPEDLLEYYRRILEGYDCVFGSRFVQGSEVVDYPFHKLLLNRLGNLIIQLLFGLKYNDITNAFKIYRSEVIEGISPLISHHFNLTVEMPLKAITRGYSYIVIPIKWRNRKKGISKLRIKEVWGRYLFIALYVLLEKSLYKDIHIKKDDNQYQIRSRIL